MVDQDLLTIANAIIDLRNDSAAGGVGAPGGGASIFDEPSSLVTWARRTSRYLGDPAWSPEDVLQEVMTRLLQDRNVPLTARPTWVYDAVRREAIYDLAEWKDEGYREVMSDIETDLRILLHWMEWQAVELSTGGMTHAQVADELQVSDRQVRNLLKRARLKIKAYLGVGYVSD